MKSTSRTRTGRLCIERVMWPLSKALILLEPMRNPLSSMRIIADGSSNIFDPDVAKKLQQFCCSRNYQSLINTETKYGQSIYYVECTHTSHFTQSPREPS